MTDRCEPPPEWRDRDGWHELSVPERFHTVHWRWHGGARAWHDTRLGSRGMFIEPADAGHAGWRYIAPVIPHAEVEALRARVEYLGGECNSMNNDIGQLERDNAALRARVAELEKHGRAFVAWTNANGFTDPENMLVCAEWHNLCAALEPKP